MWTIKKIWPLVIYYTINLGHVNDKFYLCIQNNPLILDFYISIPIDWLDIFDNHSFHFIKAAFQTEEKNLLIVQFKLKGVFSILSKKMTEFEYALYKNSWVGVAASSQGAIITCASYWLHLFINYL